MPDVSQLGEKIVTTVRSFVARSLAPLEARLAVLETKPTAEAVLEQAQRAVAVGQSEIIGRLEAAIDQRFAALPVPLTSGDVVELANVAVRQGVAPIVAELETRVDDLVTKVAALPPPEKGERGADGKDGRDGIDGRSVTLKEAEDALWPALAEWTNDHIKAWRNGADEAFKSTLTEHLQSIPPPKDGKDGADGRDGKDGERGADGKDGRDGIDGQRGADGQDGRSITTDEIKALIEPLLELRFAAYIVEHERRLPEVLQRMIDKLEKPKDGRDGRDGKDGTDGKDGEDGADGFDLRHFDVVQTDERSFTLRFKDLKREIKHPISFPVPIQRGIWREGETYTRGDVVTWGGSSFIKQSDEPGGKPEESAHWRLFVKRGRDGKPGDKGDPGEPGKPGRNGRDLTQLGPDGSKW